MRVRRVFAAALAAMALGALGPASGQSQDSVSPTTSLPPSPVASVQPGQLPAGPDPGFGDLGVSPMIGPQAPVSSILQDELDDLARLTGYAEKDELTGDEEDDAYSIVSRLGLHRPVRRSVVKLLNMRHGFLDRAINKILLRRQWSSGGDLPNLASLAPGLMRGAQPTEEGFRKLKAMGVVTVVNLRMEDDTESAIVSKLGMRSVYFPIPDTEAPTDQQARAFLSVAALASVKRQVYFHCAAGVYRTGTMAALYRIAHGTKVDAALAEARGFGWSAGWLDADEEETFLRKWETDHSRGLLERLLPWRRGGGQ